MFNPKILNMQEPTIEQNKPDLAEIAEEIKSYVNTTAELYKLKATDKGAEIASVAIINIVVGIFAGMVLLFASLALAFLISAYIGKMYSGFLIVAGFYLLVSLFILFVKDRWLKHTLVDNIIKVVYSN